MEFPIPTPALNLLVSVPHASPVADHRELVRDLLDPHYPQAMVYVVAADVATALRQGITDAAFLRDTRIELGIAQRKLVEAEELRIGQARDADAKIQELLKMNRELGEAVGQPAEAHPDKARLDALVEQNRELTHRNRDLSYLLEQANARIEELEAAIQEVTEPQAFCEPVDKMQQFADNLNWSEVCALAEVDPTTEPWKVVLDLMSQRDHHRHSLNVMFAALTQLPEFRDRYLK